jgi:hypothetical protein
MEQHRPSLTGVQCLHRVVATFLDPISNLGLRNGGAEMLLGLSRQGFRYKPGAQSAPQK